MGSVLRVLGAPVIALVGVISFSVHAQGSATLSCTPPSEFTNGVAISAGNEISYRFYRGVSAGSYTESRTAASCDLFWDGLAVGTHYFAATAIVGGRESALSNSASKTIPVISPPVSVVSVVAGLSHSPVFNVGVTGARGAAVLGFVPVGTPCIGDPVFTYRSRTYRLVPRASVVWWASSARDNAAAACQ